MKLEEITSLEGVELATILPSWPFAGDGAAFQPTAEARLHVRELLEEMS